MEIQQRKSKLKNHSQASFQPLNFYIFLIVYFFKLFLYYHTFIDNCLVTKNYNLEIPVGKQFIQDMSHGLGPSFFFHGTNTNDIYSDRLVHPRFSDLFHKNSHFALLLSVRYNGGNDDEVEGITLFFSGFFLSCKYRKGGKREREHVEREE